MAHAWMLRVAVFFVGVALISIIASGGPSGCGGEGDGGSGADSEACQLAEETYGQETRDLGESCTAGGNTLCDITYDNCIDGSCHMVDDDFTEICTMACDGDADCPSAIPDCGSRGYCTSETGGGGGGGGSCSDCLDLCSGLSGCCCGDGCLCDSECTDSCSDA